MKVTATQAHVLDPKWGDGWKIMSRTASDPDCLRGLHHPNMTVAIEEMSGVEDATVNTMLGTCSQDDNLLLGIGNPSRREGYFYRAFYDKNVAVNWPRWMQMSRAKLAEERPDLCSMGVINALRHEWGEDSDAYRVNVLGEFPKIGGDTVLPVDWVNLAAETPMHKASVVNPTERRLTMDFARFGGDENVIYRRHGNAILEAYHQALIEPTQTVYRAKRMAVECNWRPDEFQFVADATGMGQPLMQLLRDPIEHMHQSEFSVYEWHNHGAVSMWAKKYHNQITAAWFEFRERLYRYAECGGDPVSIPDDRHLIEQLISMKYKFDNKNRYKVLTKDEYKKETELNSPDRAETLVMSYCDVSGGEGRSFLQGEVEERELQGSRR